MLAISQWTGQIPNRPQIPEGCSVKQLIALGSRRKRSKVYWMLAQSEEEVGWVTWRLSPLFFLQFNWILPHQHIITAASWLSSTSVCAELARKSKSRFDMCCVRAAKIRRIFASHSQQRSNNRPCHSISSWHFFNFSNCESVGSSFSFSEGFSISNPSMMRLSIWNFIFYSFFSSSFHTPIWTRS